MKSIVTGIVLGALFAAGPAPAQTRPEVQPARRPAMASSAAGAIEWTEGEVRKIDKAAGKLTLRHGDIRNLGMPGMTMVFKARDAALLGTLKAGDRVRFKADMDGSGLVVTALEVVR
jgi:Cu(I)/Ag(I) efflux system periplasmic protein CusF